MNRAGSREAPSLGARIAGTPPSRGRTLNHPRTPRNSRRSPRVSASGSRGSPHVRLFKRRQRRASRAGTAVSGARASIFDAPPSRAPARRASCARRSRRERARVPRGAARAPSRRAAAAWARRTRRPPRCRAGGGDGFAHQDGFARLDVARRAQHAAFLPFQVLRDVQQPRVQVQACDLERASKRWSASVFVFLLHLTAVAVSSGASAKGRSWVNANAPATTSTARPARTSTDTEAALVTPGRETRKTYAPSSEKDACGKGARQRRIERPKWSAAWSWRCGVVRARGRQRASESDEDVCGAPRVPASSSARRRERAGARGGLARVLGCAFLR